MKFAIGISFIPVRVQRTHINVSEPVVETEVVCKMRVRLVSLSLVVLLVLGLVILMQVGILPNRLSSASLPSASSSPSAYCSKAQRAIPVMNVGPYGNPNYPGCYAVQYTSLKIVTVDAVSCASTRSTSA